MRIPRIYQAASLVRGGELELNETASQYLLRVLRLREADRLIIFDGLGASYDAELTDRSGKRARVRLIQPNEVDTESPLQLHIGLGISKGERMDYAIQKLVETGVASITPLITEYTVVRLDEKRKRSRHQHWQGVIISACEQSGRNILPRLYDTRELSTWVAACKEECKLAFDASGHPGLAGTRPVPRQVSVLIGPEGGLSEQELTMAGQSGFDIVRLGPRILRTETAAVAISAVLQSLWGDYCT